MIKYINLYTIKGVEMKLLIASLTLAVAVFTGCSQKNPNVDMTSSNGAMTGSQMQADKRADDLSGMDMSSSTSMQNDSAVDSQDAIAKAIAALEDSVNKIYFNFDKYDIRPDMQSKIKSNARLLNEMNSKDFSIKVEGNCDEWGTDEYNYALGLKRAKSTKDSLISYGVNESRIMIVSFGESNPECKNSDKACWDKNRRAEFKILP